MSSSMGMNSFSLGWYAFAVNLAIYATSMMGEFTKTGCLDS